MLGALFHESVAIRSMNRTKKPPGMTDMPGVITGGTECYGGRYNLRPSE